MRIGLFGGTFNPIHRGHLHIAHEVCAAFSLDRIYLIPCATPPHKEVVDLAPAQDRLKMIQLALSDSKRLWVSDVELQRKGPSYTVDTVKYFLSHSRDQEERFLLVGLDAFLELDTWKNYLQILDLIALIVMPRPVAGNESMAGANRQVGDFILSKLSQHYLLAPDKSVYLHSQLKPIYAASGVMPLNISSTNVRRQIRNGEPINSMVPEKVSEYIMNKGLYR